MRLFGSPVFVPIAVAVISGTAIGADASSGYRRYLLVRPVTITRVYLTRLAGAVAFCFGVTTALVLLGTVAALVPAPNGPAHAAALAVDPSTGEYLVRGLAAAGYVALWLTALASIGVLAGALTRSPAHPLSCRRGRPDDRIPLGGQCADRGSRTARHPSRPAALLAGALDNHRPGPATLNLRLRRRRGVRCCLRRRVHPDRTHIAPPPRRDRVNYCPAAGCAIGALPTTPTTVRLSSR